VFPLIVPMLGVITAVIGIFVVAPRQNDRSGMTAINRGFFVSAVISLILVVGAAFLYLPDKFSKLTGVTGHTILSHGGSPPWLALFAVALAGTGLLTTVGVIVSMDSFGPVTDNAQGIAEMSGDVEGDAAQALTHLDAVGNTTKAITKGIAIATAVLAATALFG